ncbi:hypothetical protein O181_020493 [Austropuccinia psidii MF-1]|uniref:Uncharacterized protein n=1 Tax=Austropuccinia psidii MF-1 TaxID=1389203 RepID=A0A9Q3CD15_9BASI|nr:hypothetical protein [Austropuccinia psidii MF-1]
MVHTRNGRSYSVQPDGSGQGRGKTRARSGKSSSRKKFLEVSRVAPHSPNSVPTNFDVNSEPELVQGNILRAEPFPSGGHRNISVQVQNLVQRRQGRGVSFIHRPEEGVGNDPNFGEGTPSGVYKLQTSSRNVQRQAQRTLEEAERSHEPSGKGQRQTQLAHTLPTGVPDSQIGTLSSGQYFQCGQNDIVSLVFSTLMNEYQVLSELNPNHQHS